MAARNKGLRDFKNLDDDNKAYLVKLGGTIIVSMITGVISGLFYNENGSYDAVTSGRVGFLIWFLATIGLSYFVKHKYNLKGKTNMQIFRIAIIMGFLCYIFFWTVVFDFFYFASR